MVVNIYQKEIAERLNVPVATVYRSLRGYLDDSGIRWGMVTQAGKKNIRLAVLLTPVGKNWKISPPAKLRSLSEWKNQ